MIQKVDSTMKECKWVTPAFLATLVATRNDATQVMPLHISFTYNGAIHEELYSRFVDVLREVLDDMALAAGQGKAHG